MGLLILKILFWLVVAVVIIACALSFSVIAMILIGGAESDDKNDYI
jgi:hypothetical protein